MGGVDSWPRHDASIYTSECDDMRKVFHRAQRWIHASTVTSTHLNIDHHAVVVTRAVNWYIMDTYMRTHDKMPNANSV